MSLRPAIVNPSQLLVRGILGSIAIPISKDDSLGVLIVLAVLVLAADALVMLNGILPIDSPNLIRADCLAIVTDKVGIAARLNLANCFQEPRVAFRVGLRTACCQRQEYRSSSNHH